MRHTYLAIGLVFALTAPALWALDSGARSLAQAQTPPNTKTGETPKSDSNNKSRRAPPPVVTPEQEQVVEQFVRMHHRALSGVLTHLKQHRPGEYRRAVRDLHRTVDRLELYREKDPERYELELKLWQAQSRSQLLVARIAMADEDQLRSELRATLEEERNLRIELLQRERHRLSERLQKLEEQITRLDDESGQALDRQVSALISGAQQRAAAGNNASSKNANSNNAKSGAQKPDSNSRKPDSNSGNKD